MSGLVASFQKQFSFHQHKKTLLTLERLKKPLLMLMTLRKMDSFLFIHLSQLRLSNITKTIQTMNILRPLSVFGGQDVKSRISNGGFLTLD